MNSLFYLLLAALLSILPISELRGGIPYAVLNGVNPYIAFLVCTAANIMIIIFIFLFLDFIHGSLMQISIYRKVFDFYLRRNRKATEKIKRRIPSYGYLALSLFVALPLPITGAWTGSFIAWFLNLDRKKSIAAIALGVFIAGIIVLLLSVGIKIIA